MKITYLLSWFKYKISIILLIISSYVPAFYWVLGWVMYSEFTCIRLEVQRLEAKYTSSSYFSWEHFDALNLLKCAILSINANP